MPDQPKKPSKFFGCCEKCGKRLCHCRTRIYPKFSDRKQRYGTGKPLKEKK